MSLCNVCSRKSWLCLVVGLSLLLLPSRGLSQTAVEPKHIIICVDGVGFSTILKLRSEGRFKGFQTPSRMVSTFPSLTNPALSTILKPAGAKMTAGYEDSFFDVSSDKMRGGIIDRFRGGRFVRGTFRELFDYHPSALKSGLGYAAPPVSTYLESMTDLIRLEQKVDGNRQATFLAYSGATDSLAHLGGEAMLESFLRRLDDTIEDIIRNSREPVVITIFSDHGNHFRKYKRSNVKAALRRAGFKFNSRIKSAKTVVYPQFGLIGSGFIFTHEANEERVANVLAAVKGVDFAAYDKDEVVFVVSRRGRATIEKRGEQYRYQVNSGDPLNLLPAIERLQANSEDGFIDESALFAATRDSEIPDALHRIFVGVRASVVNRANVVISFEDGYYSGSSLLDLFTILQATHGNVRQEQSYGFIMSTNHDVPPYVRSEDVWKVLGNPRLLMSEGLGKPDTR